MLYLKDVGALAMVVLAIAVVARLALEGNDSALGAMIATLAAGVGFFLRGRVETPGTP